MLAPVLAKGPLRSRSALGALLAAGLATGLAGLSPGAARAADSRFELSGPDIKVMVTRNGQDLPIGSVPSLAEGDGLRISAALPGDQGAHLLVVSAFLRGATNPPPREWIGIARTWKDKASEHSLNLAVPKGARQMVVLIVPETNGAQGTLVDAVRGKPGEFVRASQDLNQASLDHARLGAFVGAINGDNATHPEDLRRMAPTLARSLGIKLNEDCLSKVVEQQASCLLDDRDTLVLSDIHTNSLSDTLTGAPTTLALSLSTTQQGGAGVYSPYIGVVRDLAKVFGAFSNPQFNYLPTLSELHGETASLRLNTAPSFNKPKSVMVMAMPAIGADSPPQLRNPTKGPICASGNALVLPVEGAPLVFATGYAHDMAVKVTAPDGKTQEFPLHARADLGGYAVVADSLPPGATLTMHMRGRWGFDPFDGPDYVVQRPDGGPWNRAGGQGSPLVAGRDNEVVLEGTAPGCVDGVSLRLGNSATTRPVTFRAVDATHLAVTVPLAEGEIGDLRLDLHQQGLGTPASVTLRARAETSRIDTVDVRAGDAEATITGQRLEQVVALDLGEVEFRPDGLSREGRTDRLHLAATGTGRAGDAGSTVKAQIKLDDGRVQAVPVKIGPARPRIDLIGRTVNAAPVPPGTRPLRFATDDLLPDDAELVFSVRAGANTTLGRDDAIDVAPAGSQAGLRLTTAKGLMATDPTVLVATMRAADLPPASFGPLRYRLVKADGQLGAWQPLATLARLPRITGIACDSGGSLPCTLTGRNLFLLDAVAADADFTRAASVQPGFTGSSLKVPRPADGALHLRLRDAPQAKVTLPMN
jgi:hypothetical protein